MRYFAKFLKIIPNWVISTVVLLLIIYISLDSNPLDINSIILFEGADKLIHFIMYFVLCSAYIIDYAKSRMPHHTKIGPEISFGCLCIAIGMLLEIMQATITEFRTFDTYDLIANTLGAIVGFLVMHFYGLHKLRRSMIPLYVRRHRHSSHHKSSK